MRGRKRGRDRRENGQRRRGGERERWQLQDTLCNLACPWSTHPTPTSVTPPPPPTCSQHTRSGYLQRYRGISATGTPDGVPSNPQQIQLYPRTRKGERLLQDAQNCVGMRWSPTPYRPWKTLEIMATHDQAREDHLRFVVCMIWGTRKLVLMMCTGERRIAFLLFFVCFAGHRS